MKILRALTLAAIIISTFTGCAAVKKMADSLKLSSAMQSDADLGNIIADRVGELSMLFEALLKYGVKTVNAPTAESVRSDPEYMELYQQAIDWIARVDAIDYSPYQNAELAETYETSMDAITEELLLLADDFPDLLAEERLDSLIDRMRSIPQSVDRMSDEVRKLKFESENAVPA
ncbi:MAG: hypothetical protein LBT59_06155 [Clostridiales bacterium]|jgi:hypothetical protein|nr:hypothetical protein [Clostridiales bacterium]